MRPNDSPVMSRTDIVVIPTESDVYNKLTEGWERSESRNGVPYYSNHVAERTQWDHPILQKTMEELADLDSIKYAAYRTASKLQLLQKRFKLDQLDLHTISTVFDKHGFGMYTDLTMEVLELDAILTDLCRKARKERAAMFDPDLAAELILNLLINMFDPQRRGCIRALGCKLVLATLCNARLGEKYKFYFRHLSENGTMIIRQKFAQFVQDVMAIPSIVKESRPFGAGRVEPVVDACFLTVANGVGLHEEPFHDWLYQEPQCLVWLHTMHRMNAALSVSHANKCAVCRVTPIVGFRYKCLKCFKYNLCQQCFFTNKTSRRHKISHPIQEYCLNATSKEDTKAFFRMIRNNLVRDYKRDKRTVRYAVRNDTDQSLTWDNYAPGIEDENEDAATEQISSHVADHMDDDVISYLGLDPRHSRIIYPDDEDQVPRYIVKTEISEASGDDQPKSSSSADDVKSVQSAPSTASRDTPRTTSAPPAALDGDDGLTLPADKVRQLYSIIHQLEDENKILLEELENMHESQSDLMSVFDAREQFNKMKIREEVYQARQEILESHNKRLIDQIRKLKTLVREQEETSELTVHEAEGRWPERHRTKYMSTPKDCEYMYSHLLKTPTFNSPIFTEALRTVYYDVTVDESATYHDSLPAVSMAGQEADELDYLVHKLNAEISDEYSAQLPAADDDVSTSDNALDAARMMGEAMSQFVDKLQIDL